MAGEWPYRISDVMGLLSMQTPKSKSVRVACPFCGNTKSERTLSVDTETEVFHCFRCGESGRSGAVLYSKVMSMSTKDAHHEICSALGIDEKGSMKERVRIVAPIAASIDTKETPVASAELRDLAYSKMLSILPLSAEHKEKLLERGLFEGEIDELGYKSLVKTEDGKEQFKIPETITKENISVNGVPGFYRTKNKGIPILNIINGITVPYIDVNGNITGIQIRRNDEDIKEGESKYYWLSSKEKLGGTKPAGMIHYACDFLEENGKKFPLFKKGKNGLTYALITEGAMKADITHKISGLPVIAIPGVSILKGLEADLPRLKELGVSGFCICFDKDQITNLNVLKAQERLAQTLAAAGFEVKNATTWDNSYLRMASIEGKAEYVLSGFSNELDFAFTPKTLSEAIEDERLGQILMDLIEMGRKTIILAFEDKEMVKDPKNKEMYKTLYKMAKEMGFACSYGIWELLHKGIDDFYAEMERNVKYIRA